MATETSSCSKCVQSGKKMSRCPNPKCASNNRQAGGSGPGGKRGPNRKVSEYGRQLQEKQKLKHSYGMRESQFRRFFGLALHRRGATGEVLLELLERRLDNVVYRLKMASTRPQARQMVVHGHILVNGKKVSSPSCLVRPSDAISLSTRTVERATLIKDVVDRRMSIGIKVPAWLELKKEDRTGVVLRVPERSEVSSEIEEHLIVELYSK